MAAVFSITNLNGLAPSSGFAHSSTRDSQVDIATLRNSSGVTVKAVPRKMTTKNVTLSGQGLPNFADVAIGSITKGVIFVKSVKVGEQQDFPTFEIQGVIYADL